MSFPPDPVLDELVALNPDILAACLVTTDGTVLGARGPSDAALASLAAVLAVVAGRTSTELGRGALTSVVVEGEDGLVAVEPLDDTMVLAAVAHRGAAPGLVVADLRAALRAASARAAS